MAIEKTATGVVGKWTVEDGVDSSGVPKFVTRQYSGIKPTVTDNDFYDVMSAMAGLSSKAISKLERVDSALIEGV